MINTKLLLAGLFVGLVNTSAFALNLNDVKKIPMVNIENAIEAEKVTVTGAADAGSTYVVVQACEKCKQQTFKAQPGTVYQKGNSVLTPEAVALMQGKPATVIYSTETDKVTRVIYFELEGQ